MENTPIVNEKDLAKELFSLTGNKQSSIPRPATIRLNGTTGEYELYTWNQETKQSEKSVLGIMFDATVLVPRYQVQWKYKENATVFIRSDEFDSFSGQKFRLFKFVKNEKKQEAFWEGDYKDLKNYFVKTDEGTGDILPAPFDLHVILYVQKNETIYRVDFKGDSRSAWFDFQTSFHKTGVHLAQRLLTFSAIEKSMATGEKYMAMSFAVKGVSPLGAAVKDIIIDLKEYFDLFMKKDGGEEVEEVKRIEPVYVSPQAIQQPPTPPIFTATASPAKYSYLDEIQKTKTVMEVEGLLALIAVDAHVSLQQKQAYAAMCAQRKESIEMSDIPF